jgi:transglutaminase-like putative cysteine protease
MSELLLRLLAKIYHRLGWGRLLELLLLAGLALAAAYGIGSVLRGVQPAQLAPFLLAGLLLAAVFHGWHLRGWLAGLLLGAGGCLGVFGVVGRLGGLIRSLLEALAGVRLAQAPGLGWQIQAPELPQAWSALVAAAGSTLHRLVEWLGGLAGGAAAFDPLASTLIWSLSAWLLGAWLGWWALRRRQVLAGAAPLLSLLAWALYYTQASPTLLLTAVALVMALHMLRLHLAHVQAWEAARLDPPDNLPAVFLVMVLLIGGLAFGAWGLTSEHMQRWEQAVSEWFQPQEPLLPLSEPLASALGLQAQDPAASLFGAARQPSLPTRHLLQGGVELAQTVVMQVSLVETTEQEQAAPRRFYWRSLAFNRYNGRGWYSDPTVTTHYPADAVLGGSPDGKLYLRAGESLLRQQFEFAREGGGVAAYAGELLSLDQPYQVAWRRSADSGDLLGVVVLQEAYRATTRLAEPGAQALRQAGSRYPDWVIARYTNLPETLPPRVLNLALDLTAAQPNPYDRAIALETYLRTTYPYTLDLPAPPYNRDLVDYFLFDLQRGYCDYYASAMVVLARASGLPARLVTGYAGGTWDARQRQFTVTEADAHSWAEVYFPGYGWVVFEPTASQPQLERPEQPALPPSGVEDALLISPPAGWRTGLAALGAWLRQAWGWMALAAAGLVFLALRVDGWRLGWCSPAQTAEAVLLRLYAQAQHLGVQAGPGGTLREFSDRLYQSLRGLAAAGKTGQPGIYRLAEDVHNLSGLVEQGLFSPQALGRAEQRRCIRLWQRMRLRFWLARLRHRLRQVVDPAA